MSQAINRRYFLAASTTATLGVAAQVARAAEPGANSKIVVGVLGTGDRGTQHARAFPKLPGVQVAYVCDVDQGRVNKAAKAVEDASGKAPQAVGDFRKVLDDKAVDAVVIASCNHWHAPMSILACAAGKHVYVEKPCSHNPREGELMVEAARKYKRHVQMGNQRRSFAKIIEAIEQVRNGAIGKAYFSQSWYTNHRPSTGKGNDVPVPAGLDYELWQGPAPRRPFKSNYLPYTWHWFWNWGNGELGNNGVHMIDLCRWGLGVDYPEQVTSLGGRYAWQDDQETPDTNVVTFTFPGGKSISWQGLSCSTLPNGAPASVVFHGDKGILAIRGDGYTIHEPERGKEIKKVNDRAGDASHTGNFLAAIRGEAKLTSEIEEGYKSTLLCHLGNIAYRTGHALRCDSKDGNILNDTQAMALWSREYHKGWEPKV